MEVGKKGETSSTLKNSVACFKTSKKDLRDGTAVVLTSFFSKFFSKTTDRQWLRVPRSVFLTWDFHLMCRHTSLSPTHSRLSKKTKTKHVPWCDITMTGPLPGKYSTGILRCFQSCCIVPIPPHSSKKYQTKPWVKKKNKTHSNPHSNFQTTTGTTPATGLK